MKPGALLLLLAATSVASTIACTTGRGALRVVEGEAVAVGPRVGGDGGAPAALRCDRVVGIEGRSGDWLDRIGLRCDDGSATYAMGGDGGAPFRAPCPEGSVAVGVVGRS